MDAILNQLETKHFTYKIKQTSLLFTLPQGTHYGFLAPDVENVLPNAVKTFVNPAVYDSLGAITTPAFDFKAVNYTELIPVLFAAVKQLKERVDTLEQNLNNCCNYQPLNNSNNNNRSSLTLKNKEGIVLNQNTPNPFNESTEITYSIPETVKSAVILFYDQSGKILNSYEINHRGTGSLTVYGEDLSNGIYSYTLLLDGKNHQTKRMVKQ